MPEQPEQVSEKRKPGSGTKWSQSDKHHPLNSQLGYGDRQRLCEMTGYAWRTISSVLCGNRKNDRIIQAAEKLIEARQQIATTCHRSAAASA